MSISSLPLAEIFPRCVNVPLSLINSYVSRGVNHDLGDNWRLVHNNRLFDADLDLRRRISELQLFFLLKNNSCHQLLQSKFRPAISKHPLLA